jgi:hypothetical protein
LAARNRLIHRVLIENVEKLRTIEGRTAVIKEIRELQGERIKPSLCR